MPQDEPLNYVYRFKLKDGRVQEFPVALDGKTLNVVRKSDAPLPDWTRLEYNQCENCPLTPAKHERCPVAVNLVPLMSAFGDRLSYETVEVEFESPSRKTSKVVPLAEGIRSLLGLHMAASGCPVLDRLKPLVRTHLPFSSWDETAFRVIGSYLLQQFFIARRGGAADWALDKLVAFYDEIKIVNRSFCQRLRSVCVQDATINAVAELDSLADMTRLLITKDRMKSLEQTLVPRADDPAA
jgi:hypothetical protein